MRRSSLFVFSLVLLLGCGRSEPPVPPVVTAPQAADDTPAAPKEVPAVPKGWNQKQKWSKELTDLDTKVATLNGDYRAKTQELLKWLKARPEYEDSGTSRVGNVWARFTDGRLVMVPFPAPGTRGSGPAANPPAAPPPAAAPELRYIIPGSRNALLYHAFATNSGSLPAIVSPIREHLSPWLAKAGYVPTLGSGTITEMRAVRDAGLFYIDTHGGEADARGGARLYGMFSEAESNDASETQEADLDQGRLCYVSGGRFAVTHKFVRQYMSFAEGAFVFVNACSSETDPDFIRSFLDKGAAVYAGWNASVGDPSANIAAKFAFDRLLGSNLYPFEPDSPKQRPFDFFQIVMDMEKRRINVSRFSRSDDRGAVAVMAKHTAPTPPVAPGCLLRFHYSDRVLPPLTGLCPSLAEVALLPDDKEDELLLVGNFGPGTPRVTVAGVPVEVKRWLGRSREECLGRVVCSLPRRGPGSAGDVVLTVDDRVSNPVPLTAWRVRLRFTTERINVEPPLKLTGTIDLHLRADIHSMRHMPHHTPLPRVGAPVLAGLDSQVQWEYSGKGRFKTTPTVAVEWAGSGKMVREEIRRGVPDGSRYFDGLNGQLDTQKKSIIVSTFGIQVDKGRTETQTGADGKATTSVGVFSLHCKDWNMALDDKFGIVRGEHVWSDDNFKTKLEWDAAPAEYPPTGETLSALPLPKPAQALACLTQGTR